MRKRELHDAANAANVPLSSSSPSSLSNPSSPRSVDSAVAVPLERATEMRERIDALLAQVRAWKPHQAPRVDLLAPLASVELDSRSRDQFAPLAFAVPRHWLDAVRQHAVAPAHAPPPTPLPLHTLELNATTATAVWVSEPTWHTLCAAFGSTGAWQRGAEPSFAIRIVAAGGADDRSVVLLVPYRARLPALLSRACAGMVVSPRGRQLLTRDERPLPVASDACVGELFLALQGDVRAANVADVRHPLVTVAIAPLGANDAPLAPVPASVDDGLAMLARGTEALAAAHAAANSAFAALLEWREAMAAARQHLSSNA